MILDYLGLVSLTFSVFMKLFNFSLSLFSWALSFDLVYFMADWSNYPKNSFARLLAYSLTSTTFPVPILLNPHENYGKFENYS